MRYRLEEMTHGEVRSWKEVILPTGSIEQHGLHMPLGTDTIIAEAVCGRLAGRLNIALCPVLAYGFSGEHTGFSGTVDLGLHAFTAAVERIIASLDASFERIYVINFHGGNSSALDALLKEMSRPNVYLIQYWRAIKYVMESLTDQESIGIEHAGEFETSLMMVLRPDLVTKADTGPEASLSSMGDRIYGRAWRSERMTETGAFGGAGLASPEKGRSLLGASIARLTEIVNDIRENPGRG
jgi:creatinine amidohydrolase